MNQYFKWLLIVLSICLIVVPAAYAVSLYKTTKSAIDASYNKSYVKSSLRNSAVNPATDNFSILFLGIDDSLSRRKNGQQADEARTDSMILATFNREKKQVRLVGIPRDTLSYIPSVKMYDKITHAHAEGGPESSVHAVEQKFHVPVDYYVRINMQAFVDIVDELGGIEFDVPFDIDEPTKNDKGRIQVKQGHRLLNGDEALALARSRNIDTDLGRGKRQMEMIIVLAKKAKESGSISKLDNLVEIVGNNAKHNLTFENISAMAQYYASNDIEFKQRQLEGTDYMYNGVYYYNPVMEDVFEISKLVNNDLNLKDIKEEDLLDYKIRAIYGDLIPLQTIELNEIENQFKGINTNSIENPNSDENAVFENSSELPDVSSETPNTITTSELPTEEQIDTTTY
ncbi:LCP family protein [Macrococcus armenti]|uniref:LCP family protein n=1 Tax=Macrococcus armenti TaxID=2875764 RepID=A0ABY3ZXC4_9STAP|nr:LCP family protein [Macrococcus armenti]UOB21202.1 LCP family protein [Macrococcus armenti]